MPKYLIQWTEEHWFQDIVEAPSEDEAYEMVAEHAFDWPEPRALVLGDVNMEELDA